MHALRRVGVCRLRVCLGHWLSLAILLTAGPQFAQGENAFDPYLDTPYSVPKYLVLIVRQQTMNGEQWPNVYALLDYAADGHVGLSDGTGGTIWSDVKLMGGPYYTLRDVCSFAPNEEAKLACGCPKPAMYSVDTPHDPSQPSGVVPGGLLAQWNKLSPSMKKWLALLLAVGVYGLLKKPNAGTPRSPAAAKILEIAKSKIGSEDYLVYQQHPRHGEFEVGENKCNLMVAETIEEAGLPRPLIDRTFPYPDRRPLANEWANRKQIIVGYGSDGQVAGHWVIVEDGAKPGDVLAIHAEGGGHVGIVADDGHSISTDNIFRANPGVVHYKDWGFRQNDKPIFRRWQPSN